MDSDDHIDWSNHSAGDPSAFERIHNRHKPGLSRYCLYSIGASDVSEEIVQEVFMRLLSLEPGFLFTVSLKGWLFTCARNLCLNWKKQSRREVPWDSVEVCQAESVTIEQKLFIEQVLEKLTHEERDLILLREMQRYSIKEIASILSLSEENVRVRLHRVRKKMYGLGKET